MFLLFLQGAFVGLAISAPVGPINILCMRRSLTHGKRLGFLTGFGAAVGDTLYGAVAAFGLTWISDFFVTYQPHMQIVGGISFGIMGVNISRAKPIKEVEDVRVLSGKTAFFSTVLLTLTNPATIFAFLAAFASLNAKSLADDRIGASFMTFGVFVGSSLWWLLLTFMSLRFRTILTQKALRRINVGTGIMLIIFAIFLLLRGLHHLQIF